MQQYVYSHQLYQPHYVWTFFPLQDQMRSVHRVKLSPKGILKNSYISAIDLSYPDLKLPKIYYKKKWSCLFARISFSSHFRIDDRVLNTYIEFTKYFALSTSVQFLTLAMSDDSQIIMQNKTNLTKGTKKA